MQRSFLLLISVASMGLCNVPSNAQQTPQNAPPVSIQQFLKENETKSPSNIQFVLMRCSAVFLGASGITQQEDPNAAAALKSSAMKFAVGAAEIAKGNTALVTDQITRMSDMYLERFKASRASTGKYLEDPLVASDMTFCKLIAK